MNWTNGTYTVAGEYDAKYFTATNTTGTPTISVDCCTVCEKDAVGTVHRYDWICNKCKFLVAQLREMSERHRRELLMDGLMDELRDICS
jgi:ribosomal protein L37AE/L43A